MNKQVLFSMCVTMLGAACGVDSSNGAESTEAAVGVVSGALNNSGGAVVGQLEAPRKSPTRKLFDALNPIGTAWAASWTCTGGSLSPAFAGPGNYTYTPVSCSVSWRNGRSGSSEWSSVFDLNYSSSCDGTHPFMENQAAGCARTRTTPEGGNTRTITAADGQTYAITHDTAGAGTGWDTTVWPAPGNGGVVLTCGGSGCAAGKTLIINGSHLTGVLSGAKADGGSKVWDHTVTTDAQGLAVTGSGTSRSVSGTVIVQHNLAKYTARATFDGVTYGEGACCFPTGGTITTSFTGGPLDGKSESIAFTNVCGEATLTNASGATTTHTFQHCL